MGMLNNGMDIKDFESREKREQIKLTKEAWHAENMANLFLMETVQGNLDDFNRVSAESFKNISHGFPDPLLTETELYCVRQYLRQLLQAWENLATGETMHLTFEF
jgi:3-methyladenine DNA glycosylase AlkC